MVNIRFEVDKDKITLGDMMMLEDAMEGRRQANALASLMARFMVDDNSVSLKEADAMAIVKKMTIAQVNEAMRQFSEVVNNAAVPPSSAGI